MNKKVLIIITIVLSFILFVIWLIYFAPGSQERMERHIRKEFGKIEMPSNLELKYTADFGDAVLDTIEHWGVSYSYRNTDKNLSHQNLYESISESMLANNYQVDKEDGWLLYAKNGEIWMRINVVDNNTVGFEVHEQ